MAPEARGKLAANGPAVRALQIGKVEVLSETFDFDLDSYIRYGVVPYLRGAWNDRTLLAYERVTGKRGEIIVDFDVVQDGAVSNLIVSTPSNDPDIDEAASAAVAKSSPYDPLPKEFPAQYLRLRCHFFYNPGKFIRLEIVGANHQAGDLVTSNRNSAYFEPGPNRIIPPSVTYSPAPEFSEAARKAKVSGIVILRLTVNSSGNVSEVKVLRGLGYGLNEKATEAVHQWRFNPATKNGDPVQAEIAVQVIFRLY